MGLFKRKGKLTPSKRAKKYRYEVKSKVNTDHFGKPHLVEGKQVPLNNTQLAFRSGYLTAIKDYKKHKKRQQNNVNNTNK